MPAIAAIGVLDVVVIGFVFLLVLLAARQLFGPLLDSALSQVPVVGGWISSNVTSLQVRIIVRAAALGAQALSPVADLIRRVRAATGIYTWDVIYALEDHFNASWRILHLSIPAAAQGAYGYAAQLYNQAANLAALYYIAGRQWTDARVQIAIDYAAQLYNQAANLAALYYIAGRQYTDARIAEDVAYTGRVERDLVSLVNTWGNTLARTDAAAIAQVEDWVRGIEAGIEDWVARGLTESEAYARSLADVQSGALAAGLSSVQVQALTAIGALESKPCMKFCGPLGEMGKLAQGIENQGGGLFLIAGLVAALCDPQDTAALSQTVLRPLMGPALFAVKEAFTVGGAICEPVRAAADAAHTAFEQRF